MCISAQNMSSVFTLEQISLFQFPNREKEIDPQHEVRHSYLRHPGAPGRWYHNDLYVLFVFSVVLFLSFFNVKYTLRRKAKIKKKNLRTEH